MALQEIAADAAVLVDPESVDSIAEGIERVLSELTCERTRGKGISALESFHVGTLRHADVAGARERCRRLEP